MNKDNFLRFIITALNRLIVSAIAEKVSAIATEDYLQQHAQRADKQAFQRLLANVPNREVLSGDEL
ncbi:MAG: hypothetical protein Q8L15_11240 [Methylobacter sp.]|nr:hypothetical protein [Methylobacter sp.]